MSVEVTFNYLHAEDFELITQLMDLFYYARGSQNIYDLQCTYAAAVSCTAPVHHEETQLFILLLVPKFIKTSYALMTARLKVAIFVTAV